MPYDEPYKPANNTSETPATLVAKGGEQYRDELSPNPAHFGFTRQLFFEKLNNVSDSVKDANTLYIVPIKNGDEVVGYYKYRYDLVTRAFVRVVAVEPQNEVVKGEHKQANETAIEVTEPKVTDPLFNKINLGIKLGDIEIPSGGAKLYKHSIRLSSQENRIIKLINTDIFAYDFTDFVGYDFLPNVQKTLIIKHGTNQALITYSPGSTTFTFSFFSGTEIVNYNISSDSSDTVTEL